MPQQMMIAVMKWQRNTGGNWLMSSKQVILFYLLIVCLKVKPSFRNHTTTPIRSKINA